MKRMSQLLCLSLICLFLSGCLNQSKKSYPHLFDDYTVKKNLALEIDTDERLLSKDTDFNELAYHSQDKAAIITQYNTYPQNFQDDTWQGLHIEIDTATLLQLKDYKSRDNTSYEAVLLVHFKFNSPERDVAIYPNNSLLIIGEKQEVEATLDMGYWDGEILKGVSKSGYTPFFIKTLNIEQLKNAKLLVKANYLTSEFLDHESQHTYNIPIKFD
ncbi:hypothetical protein [Vagococcus intermedius]|nr:hypothetical protein [Vagococcus intermedius]WEG76292.1 hypothetical protein OL235_04765 [Vagococcus intermedius]